MGSDVGAAEALPAGPARLAPGSIRVRLDVAYDGSNFSGWGIQPILRTVQGDIESALARRPLAVPDTGLAVLLAWREPTLHQRALRGLAETLP